MDCWILGKYQEMEFQFIDYLDRYEVGLALQCLEKFFWNFCDDYIEIVKHRLYRPLEFSWKARYAGQKTCYLLLYKLLQDFAIFFPFITEEIFQEIYHNNISIHLTILEPLSYDFNQERIIGDVICDIISQVRGEKTKQSVTLKTLIKELHLDVTKEGIDKAVADLKATLNIQELKISSFDGKNKIINIMLDL